MQAFSACSSGVRTRPGASASPSTIATSQGAAGALSAGRQDVEPASSSTSRTLRSAGTCTPARPAPRPRKPCRRRSRSPSPRTARGAGCPRASARRSAPRRRAAAARARTRTPRSGGTGRPAPRPGRSAPTRPAATAARAAPRPRALSEGHRGPAPAVDQSPRRPGALELLDHREDRCDPDAPRDDDVPLRLLQPEVVARPPRLQLRAGLPMTRFPASAVPGCFGPMI